MSIIDDIKGVGCMLDVEKIAPPEIFAGLVDLFAITYKVDDCRVMGYLAVPITFSGPLSAIIFNRGGNREFGLLQPGAVCRFAVRGYCCLGSQYRGNAGGTGKEQFGGDDVNDVLALVDICEELSFVKSGGVFMAGHSRGGMMTYLSCARDSRIKAATIGAGVADCFMMYNSREQSMKDVFHELVGGSPEELPEAFRARSAVCWAEKIMPPLLICQGTADWRVVPEQAYKMTAALAAAGKEYKLVIYEGADHSLQGTSYIDDVLAWFKEYIW